MIAIPNVDKPKKCIEEVSYGLLDNPCLFVDEREACLLQKDSKIGEYEENYKTCPLIEIVTCGECKWSYIDERDGLMWCKVHTSHYRVNDDGFCNYGERRADDPN